MKINSGFEQSVYALVILSLMPRKALISGEALSNHLLVSPTYFQKVIRKLVNANIIASTPGARGGFKLNKKPDEICIYDVFVAIEGQQSLFYPNGVYEDLLEEGDCPLHSIMCEAENAWQHTLKKQTLQSIVVQIADSHPNKLKELELSIQQLIITTKN